MDRPKLIIINGPAGLGKSTLATRYTREHALALAIDGDLLVGSMGCWLDHEVDARKITELHIVQLAKTHLSCGYDVVIPYMIFNSRLPKALQNICQETNTHYFELTLSSTKDEAVRRMLQKGSWGEPGSPILTKKDVPIIEDLYDRWQAYVTKHQAIKIIQSDEDDIEKSYLSVLKNTENL